MEYSVQDYGYWLVFLGVFIEGEAVLLMGVLAAVSGYLEFPWVIFSAFVGTFLGDQLYFYLGRRHGLTLLAKRPKWALKVTKIRELLHRYHLPLILSIRFMYGIRTIGLIALGLSPLATHRFMLLNAMGAAIWALLIGGTGLLLGDALVSLLSKVQHIQLELLAGLLLAGAALGMFLRLRRKSISPTLK